MAPYHVGRRVAPYHAVLAMRGRAGVFEGTQQPCQSLTPLALLPAGGGVPWPTKAKQPTSPSKTHTLVCLARRGAPDQAPRAKHPDWLRASINLHMRDPHPVRRRDSPPSRPWGGLPHFHTSNAHSRYSLAHRRPTKMRAGG